MVNRNIQAKIVKMKKRNRKKIFSKAFLNSGKGPNQERMQQYYARVPDYTQELPITLGLTGPMEELKENYERIVRGNTNIRRISLVNDAFAKLDLLFVDRTYLFVETDVLKKRMRRSITYSNRNIAMAMLTNTTITWVEVLPTNGSSGAPPAPAPGT